MNKKIFIIIFIFGLLSLTGCSSKQTVVNSDQEGQANKPAQTQTKLPMSSKEMAADKVQVFLFHATQRCSTCIAIGKLAGETVNERFQDELKAGKIEFREVNIDLPENKELAIKFQASGSALYLNSIKGLSDNIEQDIKVWRLTNNPDAFKNYLEGRINAFLGK
jgi:outer membrane protein assembly factor BamE (lipoprotein component of BamABCDE complex)